MSKDAIITDETKCRVVVDYTTQTIYCHTHDRYICNGCQEEFEPDFGSEKKCRFCELKEAKYGTTNT